MLVALLLLLVLTLRTAVVSIFSPRCRWCQQSSCKLSWGSCESSHGDACGTPAPSCHDNEDHHAAGTQYVHGLHGLDEQLHTQEWQIEGQPGISFLIE